MRCGEPGEIHNGTYSPQLTSYLPGMQVTYSCTDGTQMLFGKANRTCLANGSWDGDFRPVCSNNKTTKNRNGKCLKPDITLNGNMEARPNPQNFVDQEPGYSYSCKKGYRLTWLSTSQSKEWLGCNGDRWPPTPVCQRTTNYSLSMNLLLC